MWLPFLLFSIREVPQASLGFSSFELLYGRHPRGILDLVKEKCEETSASGKSRTHYMLELWNRLEAIARQAAKNLQSAQGVQKEQFDHLVSPRKFTLVKR